TESVERGVDVRKDRQNVHKRKPKRVLFPEQEKYQYQHPKASHQVPVPTDRAYKVFAARDVFFILRRIPRAKRSGAKRDDAADNVNRMSDRKYVEKSGVRIFVHIELPLNKFPPNDKLRRDKKTAQN